MDSLQTREKALEDLFAHKQELELKIKVKAYDNLAHWTAEQLGVTEANKITEYRQNIVLYDFDQHEGGTALDKILKDLENIGKDYSKFDLEDKLNEFISQARQEIIGND